ncbi:hypothetical protein [Cytobacillus gottheilii]|uniref:Uncharacterized protein n=1 Tax=Cytobacillus gottheilii TaxID=859144 RepID=A0ABX8FG06_9BACI|nr:hypothetical protein [Cytobacillus gottheilii]QVY62941.1 hypothetical protein J1899_07825 [Cytobacillus gottheilii]
MTNLRTEKRKANVGERILITQPFFTGGAYEEGSILTVVDADPVGVYTEDSLIVITEGEYEVIIENETEADGMKNDIESRYEKAVEQAREAIEELRLAALAKGYEDAKRELTQKEPASKLTPITTQEHRDAIVEQAKADVAELTEYGRSSSRDNSEGNITYREHFYKPEFVVNKEKRTVVVLVRHLAFNKDAQPGVKLRGIAKCAPNDCFNAHIGKAIALRRALGLEVPAEYTDAPNPTEVRVGDRIHLNFNDLVETVNGFNSEGFALTKESPGCVEPKEYRIIDDTRE